MASMFESFAERRPLVGPADNLTIYQSDQFGEFLSAINRKIVSGLGERPRNIFLLGVVEEDGENVTEPKERIGIVVRPVLDLGGPVRRPAYMQERPVQVTTSMSHRIEDRMVTLVERMKQIKTFFGDGIKTSVMIEIRFVDAQGNPNAFPVTIEELENLEVITSPQASPWPLPEGKF